MIVVGDHKASKRKVLDLVEQIEYVRGLDGGGLANSHYLEEFTVQLLQINRIYKAHTGVRITGI